MEQHLFDKLQRVHNKFESSGHHIARVNLIFSVNGDLGKSVARLFDIGTLAEMPPEKIAEMLINAGIDNIEKKMGLKSIVTDVLPKDLLDSLGYEEPTEEQTIESYEKLYSILKSIESEDRDF